MADNVVSYNKRTYSEIREDLIRFVNDYYPEVLADFTDSSVGTMLLDLNAAVGNNLSVNTDRAFQETQIENAQQRSSILNIAKNLGLNIPGKRASLTVVDFAVTVPVKGDKPDDTYYPILSPGAQVVGGGKIFETIDTIDWNSGIGTLGNKNRFFVPNLDANGVIISYTVTKREIVTNGRTNVYKRVITTDEAIPFYELILPDTDVVSIESVIALTGTSFSGTPPDAEFNNINNKYFEVDWLAQQRVFVEDSNANSQAAGNGNLKAGIWINVTKKFIKEFTPNNFCKLTFGSGSGEVDAFKNGLIKGGINNDFFLNNYISNTSLGERLKVDYTLFVKYRTGGGISSNIGANVLTDLGNFTLAVNGARQDFNSAVRRSLKVNNPIPAFGGNDGLSVEQVRNLSKYNFASQFRCVTLNDYLLQVNKIPGKFGSPFRSNAFKENNKIVIAMLAIDSNGNLDNQSTSVLKNNITEYLSEYRMVNDYVEVRDGKIFNLAFDFDIYIENSSDNQIANTIIRTVANYFDINKNGMNQDVFLAPLYNTLNDIPGVINIISAKVYNMVGNGYSLNEIEQEYVDSTTREIKIINNTIYSVEDSMFEILNPSKDIRLFLRKKANLFN